MNKLNKKDYINIAILFALLSLIIVITTGFNNVFGSVVDWSNQHFTIPEYFRTLFLDTHNFFPNFAFNLGAGENIYNFSYYGLFSPVILLSYLFPFIDMVYYLIGIVIIFLFLDVFLIYKWLKKRFNSNICFISSFIFLTSAPLIYQSHHHIMFILYMPFLILALFGIDRYFDKNKSDLLITSTVFSILTNYFFSIGCIVVIVLYGIYRYIEKEKKITIKNFFKDGFKFLFSIFIAVLISSVLLLPTFYTLISNRADTNVVLSLKDILLPNIQYKQFLYSAFTIGVTSVVFYVLTENILADNKSRKFLGTIFLLILILPIILYLLNGGMYINGKVLIPFLPLFILLLSYSIDSLITYKININKVLSMLSVIYLIMMSIFVKISSDVKYLYILDFTFLLIAIMIAYQFRKKIVFVLFIMVMSLINCIIVNLDDNLIDKDIVLKQHDKNIEQIINDTLEYDHNYRLNVSYLEHSNFNKIYNIEQLSSTQYSSLTNNYYREYFFNISGNEISYRNNAIIDPVANLLFNIKMGNKYLLSDKRYPGYELLKKYSEYSVYMNNDVLPIGYAISNTISYDSYEKLSYPYKQILSLNNVVVEKDNNTSYLDIKKIDLEYEVISSNLKYELKDGSYYINALEDQYVELSVKNIDLSSLIFLKFDNELSNKCSSGDTKITINDISNLLTCSSWKYHNNNYEFNYTLLNEDNTLKVKISKGQYLIKNIEIYTINYDTIKNIKDQVDVFNIDATKTKGDSIFGDILVKEDGYFVLSIPYDEGFKISVDNENKKIQLIDNAFIGFPIEKGFHNIEITYQAPFLKTAKVISSLGLVLFILTFICERRKRS